MKLELPLQSIKFINKPDLYCVFCRCSQSKIKTCIQFINQLESVKDVSILQVYQFGGKKLVEEKLKQAFSQAKGKVLKEIECSCPTDPQEFKYEQSFTISDKKQMLAMIMFQEAKNTDLTISGNKLTIKSDEKIKQPSKAQYNRFYVKLQKLDPGNEKPYIQQQCLLCGFQP